MGGSGRYIKRQMEEQVKEKNVKKMFLHMKLEKSQTAGHKAVADCEEIMQRMGYGHFDIVPSRFDNKLLKNIQNIIQFLKLVFVKKDTEIIMEHPLYIHYMYMYCLKFVKKVRHIKLIFIIHDLEILRGLLKSRGSMKKDKIMLEIADVMIVHNEKMKNYLMDEHQIREDRLVTLDVFDYLISNDRGVISKDKKDRERKMVIAGNLSKEKSSYIYKLDKLLLSDMRINLYGANFDKGENVKNCIYKGSYDADMLPNVMEGDYGLVWDGPEITGCEGNTGNYMRYNNPHKVSLYIAAELPVIIWKQAALADFVTKNQIGFTVESLEEIDNKISKITDEQYQVYKRNLKELSERVRNGYYLKTALQRSTGIKVGRK